MQPSLLPLWHQSWASPSFLLLMSAHQNLSPPQHNQTLSPTPCCSLIHRLNYCNCNFILIPPWLLMVQNLAACLLTHTWLRGHITPVLHTLHWLLVELAIIFKVLLSPTKALHSLAPPFQRIWSDLLISHHPSRAFRSSSTITLTLAQSKLKNCEDGAFSRPALHLWNSQPQPGLLTNQFPNPF